MKGGPYSPKVEDYIKNNFLNAPNKNCELTDLAATKTAFTVNRDYKDFEYKKENLLEILKVASAQKEYKAHSKGKFAEHCAHIM